MSIPNEDRLRDQHDRQFNAGGRNSPYYEGDGEEAEEDADDEEEEEKDDEAELDNGATEAEERFGVVEEEGEQGGQAGMANSNLDTRVLELRDAGTFIPVLAVNINPRNEPQRYLMRRVGYPCDGQPNVILTRLSGDGQATNDPYGWTGGARTFPVAHNWIIEHWAELSDGSVVDVEWILGEKGEKKVSERITGVEA